ncbi:MAG: hypothetical protein RJQ09_05950 [Cyclobacteriaceae bacterium]
MFRNLVFRILTLSWAFIQCTDEKADLTGPDRVDPETENTETGTPARKFANVILLAPSQDNNSKSFYATSNGEIYTSNEVAASAQIPATVDFGYFWGSVGEAQLASPDLFRSVQGFDFRIESWATVNNGIFSTTNLQFDDFELLQTWEDIDSVFNNSATLFASSVLREIQINQVLVFVSDANKIGGSKRGLIAIRDVVPGLYPTGRIEFDVLVQEIP